jgi:hypothetical protein
MSAETASSTDTVEIYIHLLNEGTDVLRPTRGIVLGPDVVQVLATSDYDPTIEEWQFPPGSRVHCVSESRGGRTLLVARHLVEGREHE